MTDSEQLYGEGIGRLLQGLFNQHAGYLDTRTFSNEAGRISGWWLCPNEPRCPHGAVLHDICGDLECELDVPTCCVEGCDCGRNGAVRVDS